MGEERIKVQERNKIEQMINLLQTAQNGRQNREKVIIINTANTHRERHRASANEKVEKIETERERNRERVWK